MKEIKELVHELANQLTIAEANLRKVQTDATEESNIRKSKATNALTEAAQVTIQLQKRVVR
jgi:hypothetical protein